MCIEEIFELSLKSMERLNWRVSKIFVLERKGNGFEQVRGNKKKYSEVVEHNTGPSLYSRSEYSRLRAWTCRAPQPFHGSETTNLRGCGVKGAVIEGVCQRKEGFVLVGSTIIGKPNQPKNAGPTNFKNKGARHDRHPIWRTPCGGCRRGVWSP